MSQQRSTSRFKQLYIYITIECLIVTLLRDFPLLVTLSLHVFKLWTVVDP